MRNQHSWTTPAGQEQVIANSINKHGLTKKGLEVSQYWLKKRFGIDRSIAAIRWHYTYAMNNGQTVNTPAAITQSTAPAVQPTPQPQVMPTVSIGTLLDAEKLGKVIDALQQLQNALQ